MQRANVTSRANGTGYDADGVLQLFKVKVKSQGKRVAALFFGI